jgi:xanthine phosphoribosyltransferase
VEVLNVLRQLYPTVIFKTASLFYKKSARIAPDWHVHEADKWIDFFWSVDLNRKK